MSSQSTRGWRLTRERESARPQRVWLVPGCPGVHLACGVGALHPGRSSGWTRRRRIPSPRHYGGECLGRSVSGACRRRGLRRWDGANRGRPHRTPTSPTPTSRSLATPPLTTPRGSTSVRNRRQRSNAVTEAFSRTLSSPNPPWLSLCGGTRTRFGRGSAVLVTSL